MMSYKPTAQYQLVYIYTIHDEKHEGKLKVGKTSFSSTKSEKQLPPNCLELMKAAKGRIKEQTKTLMIEEGVGEGDYEIFYAELAVRHFPLEDGSDGTQIFGDNEVHDVLKNSNYHPLVFKESGRDSEWFPSITLDIVISAIKAYKDGYVIIPSKTSSVKPSSQILENKKQIKLRKEQADNVAQTIDNFKSCDTMLWDCKMRYGKTITAYELIKQMGLKRVIVVTHRPAVEDSWDTDHDLMFKDTNHRFIDKTNDALDGYDEIKDSKNDKILSDLIHFDTPFIYFASMQDLRGSIRVGGNFNKNNGVFDLDWEMIIIDEAHEGVQTDLGEAVIKELQKPNTKVLSLTGTAYGLRKNYGDNVFTWTYVDEQKAKREWDELQPNEKNPYADLPTMNILTFDLGNAIDNSYRYVTEDSAFNFREFFRTWTGNIENDFYPVPEDKHIGEFVHEDAVWSFLNLITTDNELTNYPFSKPEYVNMFKHTFWLVPGVKEAHALRELLKIHPFFKQYKIVDVAGDGDQEERYDLALSKVKKAIKENDKTITISCGRLTTGITVREWTAIMMLSGSSKTSVNGYMQAIFRVQSPGVIEGKQKVNCYAFDFAPDRALQVIANVHELSSKSKKGEDGERQALGEFLNFCPVIAVNGTEMHYYDVPDLMRQIKRISVESAINSGFDDNTIYLSDAGLSRSDFDLEILRKLSDVVAPKKKGNKDKLVEIVGNGLTNEERQKLEHIKKKPKKILTEEEKALLEKEHNEKKEQQKLFDLLRAVSIRLPLLFYGADADITEIIKLKDFVKIVDDESWEEFMPKGLRKELFLDIARYYDEDVLVGAGLRIRKLAKAADEYPPTIRAAKIVEILSKFKNPDKETVLTPWRVVNIHLSETLGGYCFYDEKFEKEIEEPRFVENGNITADIFLNSNAHILELNSKSGLYPLYMAYSIYNFLLSGSEISHSFEDLQKLWASVLEKNIFVLCKTKMARSITIRTLAGYTGMKVNAIYLTKLLERMKDIDRLARKLTNPETWGKEGERMKFDAVVGNPPYQLTKNGNNEQIHFTMLETAFNVTSQYVSLIQPLNWLNNGKLLKLVVNHVESLYRYSDSKKIFSSVQIPSGVGYAIIDKKKTYQGTNVYENNSVYFCKLRGNYNADDLRIADEVHFSKSIYERISMYVGHSNEDKSLRLNPDGDIKIWYKKESGKSGKSSWYTIDRESIPDGDIIDSWKVMISNDGHAEATDTKPQGIFNNSAIALPPGYITTNRPILLMAKNEKEAKFIARYANTKFFRRLLHIEAKSNSIAKTSYKLIPDISEFIDCYNEIEDLDTFLNRFFKLSKETIADINKRILPKETQDIKD